MKMTKLPKEARVIKDESKIFILNKDGKLISKLKRVTKDELWKIYKENIGKKCKYSDISHYCNVPIILMKNGGKLERRSDKWGINFKDELIHNFEENDYVDLNFYEQGKSFCCDIYILEEI